MTDIKPRCRACGARVPAFGDTCKGHEPVQDGFMDLINADLRSMQDRHVAVEGED